MISELTKEPVQTTMFGACCIICLGSSKGPVFKVQPEGLVVSDPTFKGDLRLDLEFGIIGHILDDVLCHP